MLPGLHTRQEKSDWEYVPTTKQNYWQRLAVRTNGWITPSNFITIVGFALTLCGLILFARSEFVSGLALCVVGRLADILDGVVADKTGTKSAIGEQLDLVMDKLTVLAAVIVLIGWFSAPLIVVVLLVTINGLNAFATLLAKLSGSTKHPSRAGKYAMALCWLVILLVFAAETYDQISVDAALYIASAAYALVGGWSSYHYLAPYAKRK